MATWLIYSVAGVSSMVLTAGNDFVSTLYLASGLGLACVLGWGPRMVWAVGAGGVFVSFVHHQLAQSAMPLPVTLALAVSVGGGIGLQAWVALKLVTAREGKDLYLEQPSQILRFLILAGPVACLVSASVATATMYALTGMPEQEGPNFFLTWWIGDTLGVLVGTPLLLPLVGQPASLWRPRRQVVSIPMLVAAILLTLTTRQLNTWEQERQHVVFLQSVQAATSAVELRLESYLHAIEAMHGLMDGSEDVSRGEFRRATRYWLDLLDSVQGIGWEERVPIADLPAFEAAQRQEGVAHYKVYDGTDRQQPRGSEVVALRFIEPQEHNLRALGFNVLSRDASREAYERARDTDTLQATRGFQLIQATGMQQGVVLYRPVYAGTPTNVDERRQSAKGTLFLTLRMDDALGSILRDLPQHLAACLYESTELNKRLLGGSPACVRFDSTHPPRHLQRVPLTFAGQTWSLEVWASEPMPMMGDDLTFWLSAVVGTLLATALGTLLLVMTGHARHLNNAMVEARRLHAAADQANRAKSEFLSRMSHELRTPLNAVLGFAQLMELDSSTPLPPSQQRRAQQIQQAGWHLLSMIDDVLDISRVDSGNMRLNCQPMPLADSLKAAASLVQDLAMKRDITVYWPAETPAEWGVNADATRLRQILTNLLSNAIKYNRPGGNVKVSVNRHVDSAQQATWRIAVSDNGLGMSAAQQAQLFQPFNRLGREGSQTDGTGIGLVISRHLAELMKGSLEVHSTEGEGSTFTLVLPAIDLPPPPEAPPANVAPDAAARHARSHEVLYVEDQATNGELLKQALSDRTDLHVSIVPTAEAALARVHNRALGPSLDLILLDLHLPDRSGLEVLKLLKANPETAHIPVIMVSADAMPEQVQAALAAGAHSYQTKPVHLPTLMRLIDPLLPN